MTETEDFKIGDVVEILNIHDFQKRMYLGPQSDIKSFVGQRYKISFVGKMIELEGFPDCYNCSSIVPTPFFRSQLLLYKRAVSGS